MSPFVFGHSLSNNSAFFFWGGDGFVSSLLSLSTLSECMCVCVCMCVHMCACVGCVQACVQVVPQEMIV